MDLMEEKKIIQSILDNKLPILQKIYNDCLFNKYISLELKLEIKDILGRLRSVLDYCAYKIYQNYGNNKGENCYFPIIRKLDKNQSATSFITDKIKGLKNQNVIDLLKSFQSYPGNTKSSYDWLPIFSKLQNKDKHEKPFSLLCNEVTLPQDVNGDFILNINGQIIILPPGVHLSLGPNSGVYDSTTKEPLILGNQEVCGGQPFYINESKIHLFPTVIWESIKFYNNDKDTILPFVRVMINGTLEIINTFMLKIK